jgi:membrane protein implicated in regulation of membrane protease activity
LGGFALPRIEERFGPLLLAMLAHGSVNGATGFAPATALAIAFVAVAVLAVVIAVATRGWLAYRAGSPPDRHGSTVAGAAARRCRWLKSCVVNRRAFVQRRPVIAAQRGPGREDGP